MRYLKALCVLALALCVTASVYAETQSVKVSGDLTVRGIFRNQYDYQGSPDENPDGVGLRTGITSAQQNWWMSVAEIEVDADLTDNVQTVIRILNQRDWNVYDKNIGADSSLAVNGRGGYIANNNEFDVMIDLAYVVLKDFIYSPLTLTIGRQDLWFGKGFIVGLNQQNPGNNLSAPEYTAINSFDAIKAVLDYDPWTITGIYSKIYGDAIQASDDVNLWGVNVGYKFDAYKAEAEGYWFYKNDQSVDRFGPGKSVSNDVHTIGVRGSLDPIDVITVFGEGAVQAGEYTGWRLQEPNRSRAAYALDFGGELRYFATKCAWKPKIGAEYILYSGNKPEDSPQSSGLYTGWDPMYRGKFDSAIREFVGKFYSDKMYQARSDRTQTFADDSRTNQNQLVIRGSIQPMDSLTLSANYNFFWTQEDYLDNSNNSNTKTGGFIGQEIDLQANWDYTEDVSFGLLAGFFMPNEVYQGGIDQTATDLVGTVKVSF